MKNKEIQNLVTLELGALKDVLRDTQVYSNIIEAPKPYVNKDLFTANSSIVFNRTITVISFYSNKITYQLMIGCSDKLTNRHKNIITLKALSVLRQFTIGGNIGYNIDEMLKELPNYTKVAPLWTIKK